MKKCTLLILCLFLSLSIIPCAAKDAPTLTIQSIHEYTKFVSENDLPDHFITYEQLSCFGDFEHLVFLEATNDPAHLKYERYDYTFSNSLFESRDERISLTLYYHTDSKYAQRKGDANVDPGEIIPSFPGTDMRTIPDEQSGVYITDGVEYHYTKGRLRSIEWSDDDYVYVLTGTSLLDTVTDKNELVNSFLTAGKTAEALEAFYDSVQHPAKSTVKGIFPLVLLPIVFGCLLILLWQLRRKKATTAAAPCPEEQPTDPQ